MAEMSIRRGTTKTFVLTLKDKQWSNFGRIMSRLVVGRTVIDKEGKRNEADGSVVSFSYSQDETIRLSEGTGEWQLFVLTGVGGDEIAAKSKIFSVAILKSLWESSVHLHA